VLLVVLNWGQRLVGNDKSTTAAILAQRIAAKIEGRAVTTVLSGNGNQTPNFGYTNKR
jgi:hypothetical protein